MTYNGEKFALSPIGRFGCFFGCEEGGFGVLRSVMS
jgi:hypothetical protein|tara:strand:+ start:4910 stop:5017 length:108 start_codon:yes stop_codon:yes gene_type:complete